MQPFTTHTGKIAPLPFANIDTDQIIPKQFLQKVTRSGFGQHLFHDWRYLDDAGAKPNPEFVLNQAQYKDASILVTGENFGCGSSREHAPWALQDFGFRVIIASSFADIFYGNCFNNGILPITLAQKEIALINKDPLTPVRIDLASQTVSQGEQSFHFHIDQTRKQAMLQGLDAIGATLELTEQIQAHEEHIPSWRQ